MIGTEGEQGRARLYELVMNVGDVSSCGLCKGKSTIPQQLSVYCPSSGQSSYGCDVPA